MGAVTLAGVTLQRWLACHCDLSDRRNVAGPSCSVTCIGVDPNDSSLCSL